MAPPEKSRSRRSHRFDPLSHSEGSSECSGHVAPKRRDIQSWFDKRGVEVNPISTIFKITSAAYDPSKKRFAFTFRDLEHNYVTGNLKESESKRLKEFSDQAAWKEHWKNLEETLKPAYRILNSMPKTGDAWDGFVFQCGTNTVEGFRGGHPLASQSDQVRKEWSVIIGKTDPASQVDPAGEVIDRSGENLDALQEVPSRTIFADTFRNIVEANVKGKDSQAQAADPAAEEDDAPCSIEIFLNDLTYNLIEENDAGGGRQKIDEQITGWSKLGKEETLGWDQHRYTFNQRSSKPTAEFTEAPTVDEHSLSDYDDRWGFSHLFDKKVWPLLEIGTKISRALPIAQSYIWTDLSAWVTPMNSHGRVMVRQRKGGEGDDERISEHYEYRSYPGGDHLTP
ncbi:hypothetical protein I302_104054 [Kwoniella bestiolae CBS 10118]|uniref:Uncharacterized protein n=1 Tax=Kwoniella bestiolae CBS 10118 TaxID=1296100 RepID=A0A1B9GA61_9TREE|nr:hypothetical protein I302_02759 [Kwoniella bestiolae CBS 10118]OCF27909.1 hypothetical protein I302_02759 [Kwoniella bestiolae CBS 10118]